jgi:FSR family fosmidomycin resistance protein-like MFS transporter
MEIDTQSKPPGGKKNDFQTDRIATIIGGHFFHDTFSAFVPPLLPLLIERLSISLTQAGVLNALLQLPAIFNPLIGHLADRISLRYFVIFAPAVTATMIGLMGFAPNFNVMAVLFLLIGFSVAAFHSPAPAIIARVSGKRVGFGMSLFMASGELGRTVGPIIAVSAVAAWGLEGIYRLIAIGWISSLILLWRFRGISAKPEKPSGKSLRADIPRLVRFFSPIFFIVIARAFLTASLTTYLPTFLRSEGASLFLAGISLSVMEGAGVVGALASGTISDKVGRKPTLLVAFTFSALLMFVFLYAEGWLVIPVLMLLGLSSLSPQPVLLALVQDHVPDNRALANGIYLMLSFVVRSIVLILLGMAGDLWGLRTAFFISGAIALLAIPAIVVLPKSSSIPATT